MTIYSGIFNSVNGDRKYNAWWFAKYFSTFIGNGVFPNPSTGLQVVENNNMGVIVREGKGWIDGYFLFSDSNHVLQIDQADGVLKRIDRVVMRLNYINRQIELIVKKGAFASNPVAPALKRDADMYELALADIFVGNGATRISQGNITDQRLNTALCGIVHGTVNQVDTTTIFNQYQSWFENYSVTKAAEFLQWQNNVTNSLEQWADAQERGFESWQMQERSDFESWLLTIQGILNDDMAGNLLTLIRKNETSIADLSGTGRTTETVKGNAEELKSHKKDYVKHPAFLKTTNVGNAYEATLADVPNSYVDGMCLVLTINQDSTGSTTINLNKYGAVPIVKANGNSVTNLKAGGIYTLRYNSSTSNFILQGEGGEYGTANATQVLSGFTFGTEDGLKSGTMINRGSVGTQTLTTQNQIYTIPAGYHNGSGRVQATYQAGKKVISGSSLIPSNSSITVNLGAPIGALNVQHITGPASRFYTSTGSLVVIDNNQVTSINGTVATIYSNQPSNYTAQYVISER